MTSSGVRFACLGGFALLFYATLNAQTVAVYQTTADLVEGLSARGKLHFGKAAAGAKTPVISVDDGQRFQEIDGFGASLTDSAG